MKFALLLVYYASFVSATVFTVGVGKDETTGKKGVGFDPSVINPVNGDEIIFEFRSGTHSVVQSTFDQPCTPKPGGFNSGAKTVADNLDVDAPGLPTATFAVKDGQPLWFYDRAGGTCNQGGILAVNPSGSQTAASFKENAMKATVAPVNTTVAESGSSSSVAPTTASSSTTSSQRASKTNAAAITASQVALSSLTAIMNSKNPRSSKEEKRARNEGIKSLGPEKGTEFWRDFGILERTSMGGTGHDLFENPEGSIPVKASTSDIKMLTKLPGESGICGRAVMSTQFNKQKKMAKKYLDEVIFCQSPFQTERINSSRDARDVTNDLESLIGTQGLQDCKMAIVVDAKGFQCRCKVRQCIHAQKLL
ncbi:hypothetical protein V5O48_004367 [Marasmius crinis-equi]|uniref:Uncharacterized protein n=1 Tax=Marasmius crinis-equi TaxID=585013 RepID=A0ABR3FQL1_9AGAR